MAMAVARRMAENAGRYSAHAKRPASVGYEFDSAGTHAHHFGGRPDPRANLVLRKHGYGECRHRARRVEVRDFERFDLILAMDQVNLGDLRRQCPSEQEHKLQQFLDFAPGLRGHEVPDPYYGNMEGFERVLALCEAGTAGLMATLDKRA